MTVASILQRQVDLAERNMKVRAAAQRMGARNVGCLIVVDDENRPIGILTDRDLALRVLAEGRSASDATVSEVMTPSPRTIRASTETIDALEIMRGEGVRRLPVIDEDDCLLGIVTLDDILCQVARTLERVRTLVENTSPRALARA